MRSLLSCFFWTITLSVGIWTATEVAAQEASEAQTNWPLDEEGRVVQFKRDIAPILKEKCLDCHGPDDAKNDFRVDDRELMMDYIEPGDVEASTMYVDYLIIDDEDYLMPPTSRGGPLSASELALIRVWIEEGADWPEDYQFAEGDKPGKSGASTDADMAPSIVPKSLSQRVWMAQGFLHPAMVHFPIALLSLGAGFVVFGWVWPSWGTQIPLTCLLLGAASSVLATLMGWAFAPEQGYGAGWNVLDWDREVDVHRWSGVIVSVVASVFAVIALIAVWKQNPSLTKTWKIGLLVCAGMVGAVGHQGGEMSYGSDFYPRAWRILIGDTEKPMDFELETASDSDAESDAESEA